METSMGGDAPAFPEEFHSLVRRVRRVELNGFDATGIKSIDVYVHGKGALASP